MAELRHVYGLAPNGRGLAAAVKASAVNGSIQAERRLRGEADLTTVNGQLEADFDVHRGGAAMQLRNVNGGISIHSAWKRHREPPLT